MNRFRAAIVLATACLLVCPALAQNEKSLTRDEVSVFKKKLVALFESLGQPPAGYSVERESFSLPTEAYSRSGSSSFSPVGAYATREYETGKGARDAGKNLESEYQKKILEAQAKGDYEAIARIAEEMQKKAGEISLKAHEGKKSRSM